MKILDVDEAGKVLSLYPELRVSDIPPEGLLLVEGIVLSANQEGEVTLFDLRPDSL